MNPQLIDLAMEANDLTGNQFDLNHKPLAAFLAMFSELIVNELADNIDWRHQVPLTHDGEFRVSKLIKQHFGIEE